MNIRFGVAGNSLEYLKYNENSINMPKWLHNCGLDAYEYQCGRGINISDDQAKMIGKMAKKYDINVSLHAPYFINLVNDDLFDNNFKYIYQSINKVKLMNGNRIVVHCGFLLKNTRIEALSKMKINLLKIIHKLYNLQINNFFICIETMGKINVLGTLEEVLDIIKIDECLLPCIDFGHLYARSLGQLNTLNDFKGIFEIMEKYSTIDKIKNFHCHFSKIEFSDKGEIRHLTYDNKEFGPNFDDIAKLIKQKKYSPIIICESRHVQDKDAILLKKIYSEIN